VQTPDYRDRNILQRAFLFADTDFERIDFGGSIALDLQKKPIMILRQGSCPKDEKPGES